MEKKQIQQIAAAALMLALTAAGGTQMLYHRAEVKASTPPTREEIVYLHVDAPAPTSNDGTVSAKDWQETYPYIVDSLWNNSKNDYVTSYLEEDPYLVNIYEGYGFAKDYGSARGHEYCLEDVAATARPHPKANCLTCKTPNFARMVQEQGVGVYSMAFDDVYAMMEESVSCYTCHGNNPGDGGKLTVTHTYVLTALGDSINDIQPATMACGQCHIEYHFTPSDSETMMPYHDVAGMTPEAILDYYNAMDFADWTQESTGARMLKAQHPELETFLQGKHASLLTCADCHMELTRSEDGTVYHSHTLISPLESKTILASCTECHGSTDMVTFVRSIQKRVTARETEVGNKLSNLKDALAAANADGTLDEAALEQVRTLYREAQWFFDFCYVENSEGAHNSELAYRCLDTSEGMIDEAMGILE
ncbi:MAG: ammonia-forming cytochrome c nitrite reductase subunit c552 [Oscillibacter sp.]|nr:ammonia-forming cytochrome c nitrite reductase subunit c552 [Oscillibacter sp.]